MKRTITVGELERRCRNRKPGRIIFHSNDQKWNKVASPIRFDLNFHTMQVAKNPDIIFVKNDIDSVYFQRIRHIIVDDEKSLLGTVLHIICDSENSDGTEVRYTLIDTQTEHLV